MKFHEGRVKVRRTPEGRLYLSPIDASVKAQVDLWNYVAFELGFRFACGTVDREDSRWFVKRKETLEGADTRFSIVLSPQKK